MWSIPLYTFFIDQFVYNPFEMQYPADEEGAAGGGSETKVVFQYATRATAKSNQPVLDFTFINKPSHNNHKIMISQDSGLFFFLVFPLQTHFRFLITSYFITKINKKAGKHNERPSQTRLTIPLKLTGYIFYQT